jgi:hypothetical protein
MFDEEAEEYANNTRIKDKNTYISFPGESISEVQDFEGNYIDISERIIKTFKDASEFGYNKALKEIWHYPSKGEYPEKGKEILLYTKILGLIFGEFCKGYKNLWTSNRCDFTTEEIIAWIEKEKNITKRRLNK